MAQRRRGIAAEDRGRLQVGVTGHRSDQLGDDDLARLSPVVGAVLAELARLGPPEAMRQPADHPALGADPWLVGALADGADILVAELAVATGFRLEVILPFDPTLYLAGLPAPAQTRYRALMESGRVSRLVTLGQLRDPSDAAERAAAYLAAGRQMIARSDLMIALWNGKPPRGPGGTAQMVAEARAAGVPVVWIDGAGHVMQAGPGADWQRLDPHSAEGAAQLLALARIGRAARIFPPLPDGPAAG